MKNQGSGGRFSIRTALLMLSVTVIILALFIGLPANLVSVYSIDDDEIINDTIFWSCTKWSSDSKPVYYARWTWDTNEQPEITEWADVVLEAALYVPIKCIEMMQPTYLEEPNMGILQNLHRNAGSGDGYGKLHFELNPENENQIMVSGYLQYGELKVLADETIELLIENHLKEYALEVPGETGSENLISLLMTVLNPIKKGMERNEPLGIILTNFYTDDSAIISYPISTDQNGYFNQIIEPDPEAQYYEIKASCAKKETGSRGLGSHPVTYWGNSVYYSSYFDCDTAGLDEVEETKHREWIFIGIVVAGTVFLITWYLWHRKREVFVEHEEEAEEKKPEIYVPDEIGTMPGEDTVRLEIHFPQIEEGLADVWSTDGFFEVRFRLQDDEGTFIPDTECRIEWGDGQEETAISDNLGEISGSHIFMEKADYVISGSYTDIETNEEVSSTRTIKIVDYREETVRVFNRMLNRLDIGIVGIDKRLTAREIKRVLATEIGDVPPAVIDVIIGVFEEADYSTHEISRNSYIRMYRAVQEVIGFGERKREQNTTE